MDQAFVTLATNDRYSVGALVLCTSLREVKTKHATVCMITPGVSPSMRRSLEKVFDDVHQVDLLDSEDTANLSLLDRPELGVTLTKLHCWQLTQYRKCVFLDADTLVLRNSDELLDREELSAAPDPGWPDCFNSGVFVFTPNKDTFTRLVEFAKTEGSFDGGDQGLLNMFFSDWAHTDIKKHLPFLYNVVPQATYSYLPAFRRFGSQTKICHFIGAFKPWDCSYNESTGQPVSSASTYYNDNFLSLWWQRFVSSVLPLLSLPNAKPGLEAKLKEDSQVSETDATVEVVSEARRSEQSFSTNLLEQVMPQLKGTSLVGGESHPVKSLEERQTDWEHGDIDYLGADSFEEIRKHLDSEIGENSSRQRNIPPAKSSTTTKAKPLKSALKKGSMFADSSP